ncbi:hypothetical protein JXL83_01310 [candidate division WOR-3 bacterium]|nr:hypothetical protein [candidate division WOR-3 bacterium]
MKKEEVEIFKKLFETGKWEEALRFSEKMQEEDISLEFRSVIYFNTGQKKRGEDISSELIKEYIKKHDFFECLAFMELMRVFSKKNYRNYFKVQNRISIQAKFWSGLFDVIRDVFITYGSDAESVVLYIESLKQYVKQNTEVLKMLEDIITIVKTKKVIETVSAKDVAQGLDFSVPKYLEKIGSNENAAYSYIKLAKKAVELRRFDELKNSIESLERLGYGGLIEVKELKKTLDNGHKTDFSGSTGKSISETVINFIDGIYDSIPVEAPENHVKLAQSLFKRALYEQTKNEYLLSVLTYSVGQRKTYIENLFSELSNLDIDWANEVMDFFLSSGRINQSEIKSIKVRKPISTDQDVLDLTREIMTTMEKTDLFSETRNPDESKTTIGLYTKNESAPHSITPSTDMNQVSDDFIQKTNASLAITEDTPEIKNIPALEPHADKADQINEPVKHDTGTKENMQDDNVKIEKDDSIPSTYQQKLNETPGKEFPGFSVPDSKVIENPFSDEEPEGNIDFL